MGHSETLYLLVTCVLLHACWLWMYFSGPGSQLCSHLLFSLHLYKNKF